MLRTALYAKRLYRLGRRTKGKREYKESGVRQLSSILDHSNFIYSLESESVQNRITSTSNRQTTSTMSDGVVQAFPRTLLRLEAATIFGTSIWLYANRGYSWKIFAAGLLLPDLGMVGFLKDSTLGAIIYNLAHSEVAPIGLLTLGLIGTGEQASQLFQTGLIWMAHIGMDRMLGYGLKYMTGFGHTHLGRIGN